jgi:hypothetical protein
VYDFILGVGNGLLRNDVVLCCVARAELGQATEELQTLIDDWRQQEVEYSQQKRDLERENHRLQIKQLCYGV